jgi:hypothetical protein
MEEGEQPVIPDDRSDRSFEHRSRSRERVIPKRIAPPTVRKPEGQPLDHSRYHFRTTMALREATYKSYMRLHTLNERLNSAGVQAPALVDSLIELGGYLACSTCNELIERCDSAVYVFPCAHVVHKAGRCWAGDTRCKMCNR